MRSFTPINTMLGMNEMILREERQARKLDDAGARKALRRIGAYAGDVEHAGHNLLAIVNDILDFSKIEAGRLDLVEAPYQLGSLLNDLSNMVYFKAQNKQLDYIIDVDPSLPNELCGAGPGDRERLPPDRSIRRRRWGDGVFSRRQ